MALILESYSGALTGFRPFFPLPSRRLGLPLPHRMARVGRLLRVVRGTADGGGQHAASADGAGYVQWMGCVDST